MSIYTNTEIIRCPRLLTTVYDTKAQAAVLWLDMTHITEHPCSTKIGGYPIKEIKVEDEKENKTYILGLVLARLIKGLD